MDDKSILAEQKSIIKQLKTMPTEGKNKLMSMWMMKERDPTRKTATVLLWLDDEWDIIYQSNRIKTSFTGAKLMANTHVLELIYGK